MTESIISQKFSKLTVIDTALIRHRTQARTRYICRCECGNETFARKDHLISGKTKSCGKCNSRKIAGKTIEELAEESGLSTDTIRYRIKKGLPYEQVIAPPAPRYQKCGSASIKSMESPLNIPYYWQVQND